ncbi:hypothetical protein BWD12_02505 [Leptospira santarosai serovar Bananal]|nr:hypothetical protein BWD11_04000 [Leptospira santarosai serovar Grippotyphosa]ONF81038.1 hypothetical protein BWD12_02505 [Leptospira santarosai serovar Bananal]
MDELYYCLTFKGVGVPIFCFYGNKRMKKSAELVFLKSEYEVSNLNGRFPLDFSTNVVYNRIT